MVLFAALRGGISEVAADLSVAGVTTSSAMSGRPIAWNAPRDISIMLTETSGRAEHPVAAAVQPDRNP